mmetsp:Transcript_26467/g.67726  ORF Transcript_26467/g.67726 Transcript_26467/m.67726 type:complete len:1001 (-) Transcript_26467:2063-5065(-)
MGGRESMRTKAAVVLWLATCLLHVVHASHFRFATLSYDVLDVSSKEVRFTLVSSFRRSYAWPKSDVQCQKYPTSCWSADDGMPGVGDIVRIVGLAATTAGGGPNAKNRWVGEYPYVQLSHGESEVRDQNDPARLGSGTLETSPTGNDGGWDNYGDVRFCFGDEHETGEECVVVDMTVFSYSAGEDWLMAEAVFTHKYARGYQQKGVYLSGANAELGDDAMGYRAWKATFSGCCRLDSAVMDNNGDHPFDVSAEVLFFEDKGLNDTVHVYRSGNIENEGGFTAVTRDFNPYASAVVRSLPAVTLDVAEANGNSMSFSIPATPPLFYHDTLSFRNGFHFDDVFNNFERNDVTNYYSVSFPSPRFELVSSTSGFYEKPDAVINEETGEVVFNEGPGVYSLLVGVWLGSSYSEVDMMVRVVDSSSTNNAIPSLSITSGSEAYCYVGYSCEIELEGSDADTGDSLSINYVFASASLRSTHRHSSTMVEDKTGRVEARPVEKESRFAQVFAGLPDRYRVSTHNPSTPSCPFITDVAVTYSTPPDVQNAVQDVTYFAAQRQYSSFDMGMYLSETEAEAAGFEQVAGPDGGDVNSGTGGAVVKLWVKRECGKRAVTELAVAYTAEEGEALVKKGAYSTTFNVSSLPDPVENAFLFSNLNEGSGSQRVALFLLRGSGPAVTDMEVVDAAASLPAGFIEVAAAGMPVVSADMPTQRDLNFGATNSQAEDLRLAVEKYGDNPISRVFEVDTLRHEDIGVYYACFSAVDDSTVTTAPAGGWEGGRRGASTQTCLRLHVLPDLLPSFTAPHRAEEDTEVVVMGDSVAFNVNVTHPNSKASITLTLDGPGSITTTAPPSGFPSAAYSWSPSEQWGGWKGGVCFDATQTGGIDSACYAEAEKMAALGLSPPVCLLSCLSSLPASATLQEQQQCFRRRQSARDCVSTKVVRCVYQLKAGEDLDSVSEKLGTNWLQLWQLNALMPHPDSTVQPGDRINVGHLFTAGYHDTMKGLASR